MEIILLLSFGFLSLFVVASQDLTNREMIKRHKQEMQLMRRTVEQLFWSSRREKEVRKILRKGIH